MHDESTSTEKWLSALSDGGVGFKVWDSTVDLEHGHLAEMLTDAGQLVIEPLPEGRQSAGMNPDFALAELMVLNDNAEFELDEDEPAQTATAAPTASPQPAVAQVEAPVQPPVKPKKQKTVVIIAEKYQVVSNLGKGVMCNVYKVKDIETGKMYILKVLPREVWNDPQLKSRFAEQAQIIQRLEQDNLIPFRATGQIGEGQPYILMDYLHGITLARAIAASDGLPLTRVVQVFDQLCRGLGAAHQAGVVHRDFRPENIMFLSKKGDYNVKLVDFGLARLACEGVEPMKLLETTGEIFGSPHYMSPEECRGEKADSRSDIYALGCVMFTAMTGQPPFQGTSTAETLKKQIGEAVPHPSKVKRSICSAQKAGWVTVADLEYIVLRCLEKNPANRYQSVDEILTDLDKLRKQIPLQQIQHKAASGLRTSELDLPRVKDEAEQKNVVAMVGVLVYILIAVAIVTSAGFYFFLMPKSAAPAMVSNEDSAKAPEQPKQTPSKPPANNGSHVPPALQLPPPPADAQPPPPRDPPTPPRQI